MIRTARSLAVLALIAVIAGACAKPFASGAAPKPLDVFAASPSTSDVSSMLGGGDWWTGPPTFGIRPLDVASVPANENYSVTRRFLRLGTAESWQVRYTEFDKTSSATSLMTTVENSVGSGVKGPAVGDKALYFGSELSSSAAPFEASTVIRVGAFILEITWDRKDKFPTVDVLGKIGSKVVSRLKDAIAGKLHATPLAASDAELLPPAGTDITMLASVKLPIEALPLMTNQVAPVEIVRPWKALLVDSFIFGAYALNKDTRMEVQAGLFTLPTVKDATDLADAISAGSKPLTDGLFGGYDDANGPGQYQVWFRSGNHIGLLVCRSVSDTEAAARACEQPIVKVAGVWSASLGG